MHCFLRWDVPPSRLHPQGVTALQEAAEAYLVGLFEDAQASGRVASVGRLPALSGAVPGPLAAILCQAWLHIS